MQHKILIVDDDKKTVDLIRLYLEKEHYQVLVAYDGQEALDATREKKPDLVILDWMLPKIDGPAVCRTLRLEGSTPIIMLTARSTEAEKLLGLDLGAALIEEQLFEALDALVELLYGGEVAVDEMVEQAVQQEPDAGAGEVG